MASYYSTLGVGKDADSKDIRRAFRRKARSYHPDLNPGDQEAEARFKEINEAYEVLSDAESRRKYDAYGDQWKQADQIEAQRRASRPPFGYGGARRKRTAYEGDIFGGLEDIFGDIGGFGRTASSATVSTEATVTVSLAEAFSGTTVTANLSMQGRSRRFEVDIPPGVDNGSTVRVTPERGTELLFRVTVTHDSRFRRDGIDIHTDANVPFEDGNPGRRGRGGDDRRAADLGHHTGKHTKWTNHPAQGPGDAEAGIARYQRGPLRHCPPDHAQQPHGGGA